MAAGVAVVGVLARYFKRQNRVDPAKLKRSYYFSRRSRVSGVRSPNGGKRPLFVTKVQFCCYCLLARLYLY